METQAQTERFLSETDPRYVSLCLDTGHLAHRQADVPAVIRRYPDRIGYPVDIDPPLPIATRTRAYLNSVGL